ncbi:DNA-protecting protein DprA [Chimaeribacter arupi]|uniref:DNA-protecting protein DprA n=1 Tax=Chimaeribacter arupi TaxID=2060066 RepID=UPI000C7DFDAD|nr:DNA-protecting protein DprA [Chimaeribacter arupi]PLR30011.1 DNA-protecting protein DprA [Chimaeribacter arupi]PLR43406.1 DNA-protecting protein DprA [Chimaeribacter arupi]
MTQEEIWLRLAAVRGLRNKNRVAVASRLSPDCRVSASVLQQCGLSKEQTHSFLHTSPQIMNTALSWLAQAGNQMLTIHDPAYPFQLAQIADPPPILFISGKISVLATPQVSIVGSRQCSDYGEFWGKYFAGGLVHCGYTITSGLALGIDGLAHQAALETEGQTIAVLGCGLLHTHPRRHQRLRTQIIESGGAVVSELLPSEPAMPVHFPRRNRIISGLSRGTLVVEASLRSGSLITARCALEQGREVFALPGSLGTDFSAGTHWLIQQGAYLVTEPKDIAEVIGSGLQWLPTANAINEGHSPKIVNEIHQELNICAQDGEVELPFAEVLANVGYEVTPVDVVAERAGQPVPEVVVKLLDLELAGWIAAVSGGYVRTRRAGHVRRTNVLI